MQLLPALRPYYDTELGHYGVVGHIGGEPYEIGNPEDFQKVLADGQLMKASKVCVDQHLYVSISLKKGQLHLWCLQILVPKIPTIIVVVKAIGNDSTAEDLYPDLRTLFLGLLEHKHQIISYTADGSNVKRNLQKHLKTEATHVRKAAAQDAVLSE
jgi:hypothetical protein